MRRGGLPAGKESGKALGMRKKLKCGQVWEGEENNRYFELSKDPFGDEMGEDTQKRSEMKGSSVKGRFLGSQNVGESNFVIHKTERWVIALYISKNNMFLPAAKESERKRLSCQTRRGREVSE